MTSRAPGSPQPRNHPEPVVSTQPDTDRTVVRYRVLLHDRPPTRLPTDDTDDTNRPTRPGLARRALANVVGGPPITAPMATLAVLVVLCYSAIMVAAFGTAGGIVVLALGVAAIVTLYLIGRR